MPVFTKKRKEENVSCSGKVLRDIVPDLVHKKLLRGIFNPTSLPQKLNTKLLRARSLDSMISVLLQREQLYSCDSLPTLEPTAYMGSQSQYTRRDSGYVGSVENTPNKDLLFYMEM